MENMAIVSQYLGGTVVVGTPATELDLVPLLREGLPFSAFTSLREHSQLSEETLCSSLGIAKRTAARRKAQSARLKPGESESLLRLARVLAGAVDVLGSEEKACTWLLAENRALGGKTPLSLLDTGIGFEEVMKVLQRIEHGVYS